MTASPTIPIWCPPGNPCLLSLNTSYCTDDYFGFLDPPEGGASTLDLLDIGIGRLPARNAAEGQALVDKIIAYASDPDALGNWRTSLLFAADDVDEGWEGLLMGAAENAAQRAYQKDPRFNQQKIYQDSYTQIVTGGSERYPKAREDLKRSIENGQLVCAFTGHGGEIGLSSERILQVPDIQTFSNAGRLPLFITITCEFSRFDDPKGFLPENMDCSIPMEALLLCIPLSGWCMPVSKPLTSPEISSTLCSLVWKTSASPWEM